MGQIVLLVANLGKYFEYPLLFVIKIMLKTLIFSDFA